MDKQLHIKYIHRKPYFKQCVTQKESCKKCWARFLCGGGCYYSAYIANKSIELPDEVLCALIKYLVELSVYFLNELQDRNPGIAKKLYRYAEMKNNILQSNSIVKIKNEIAEPVGVF